MPNFTCKICGAVQKIAPDATSVRCMFCKTVQTLAPEPVSAPSPTSPTVSYEGSAPYIFISYAHADSDRVLPIVHALMAKGFRVWYDAGIEAGTEWPEYIATHLLGCGAVLAFVSKNFDNSQNCRREINYAIDKKKKTLVVHLESFQMSPGMDLQLGTLQSIFANRHFSRDSLVEALAAAAILKPCL